MADPTHLAILEQGVEVWNRWRKSHSGARPDLSFANLHLADLREANLRRAELRGIDLSFANLHLADLSDANLRRANLSAADLSNANLIEVDLSEADLSNANLHRAYLQVARLRGARLSGAILTDAGLFETQRAGWFIQDVICEAVYWDVWRKERTAYAPGEFERLFAEKSKFVLHYVGGLRSIEIATMLSLIQRMESEHPGCTLQLHAIEETSGGDNVTLVVDHLGRRTHAQIEAMKAELEATGKQRIKWQRQALEEASKHEHAAHHMYQMFIDELRKHGMAPISLAH